MRRLALALLLLAAPLSAQTRLGNYWLVTEAQLQAIATPDSKIYVVTNGDFSDATPCTPAVNGTDRVICTWDGAAWVATGDGNTGTGGSGDITGVGDCASGACFQAETARFIFAAPAAGGVASFRALVEADISDLLHFSPNADPGVDHSSYVAGHGDGANCSPGNYPLGVDAAGAVQSCTADADTTCLDAGVNCLFAASVSEGGPASTATALAANGANCGAGEWASGVDASGAAEGCTPDDIGTDTLDDLSNNQIGDLLDVTEAGADAGEALVSDGAGAWSPSAAAVCLVNGTNCPVTPGGPVTQSVHWLAEIMAVDPVQCGTNDPPILINGIHFKSISCPDDDTATIYGHVTVPKNWNAGTLTFRMASVQTAADTNALHADLAVQCRGAGETVDGSSWSSEVAMDIAAMTGSNAVDWAVSVPVTPAGACAQDDLIVWRWQVDAAGSTTAFGTLHMIGMRMDYVVSGGGVDGDSVEIEDGDNAGTFTAIDTTARFDDSGDINFAVADGGAGGPDIVTATVRADSVALGTDTTGNYAAGDAEAGAALSGDSAVAFFPDQNAGTDLTADLEEEGQINATVVTGNAADDQVILGSGASAAAYASIPDCNTEQMLTYTASTNTFGCEADDSGAGGGDPVLIDGTAIVDAAGVDFIGGVGIDYTLNTAASPDTATASFDGTELNSFTWGDNSQATITHTYDHSGAGGDGSLAWTNLLLSVNPGGGTALDVRGVASAVNNVEIRSSATTLNPSIRVVGTDATRELELHGKGTGGNGGVAFFGNAAVRFRMTNCTGSTWCMNAVTSGGPGVLDAAAAAGTATVRPRSSENSGLGWATTNTPTLVAGAVEVVRFPTVASAVNSWSFSPSTANNPVTVTTQGTSTNIGMTFSTKGTAPFDFTDDTINLPAGAIDATTEIAGSLCGTNQILEDQGASWACINTPGGGGNSFGVIGAATADTGNDTITVTDSATIDFTTTNDPEDLTAAFLPAGVGSVTWLPNADATWTFDIAAAGTNPTIAFASADVEVDANLTVDNEQEFRLKEGDGGGENYLALKAPATVTSNQTCTLEDDANFIPDSCVGDGVDGVGTDTLDDLSDNNITDLADVAAKTGTGTTVVFSAAPAFTGDATAATPAADDNDTSIATTAYVQGEINGAGGRSITATSGVLDADIETYRETKCINIDPDHATTDWLFFRAEAALTVTGIDCLVDAATSVVLTLRECDANGGTCGATEAAMTCGTTNTTESAGIDDSAVDAGDWMRVLRGAVTGSPTQVNLCVTFTWDD